MNKKRLAVWMALFLFFPPRSAAAIEHAKLAEAAAPSSGEEQLAIPADELRYPLHFWGWLDSAQTVAMEKDGT